MGTKDYLNHSNQQRQDLQNLSDGAVDIVLVDKGKPSQSYYFTSPPAYYVCLQAEPMNIKRSHYNKIKKHILLLNEKKLNKFGNQQTGAQGTNV